jgi:hypothetical protein
LQSAFMIFLSVLTKRWSKWLQPRVSGYVCNFNS